MPDQKKIILQGAAELRSVRKQSRHLYWVIGLFSFFANLLMLTGPIYMMQVYDRVLSSKSQETLIALSLLVVFLYTVMGVLNFLRGRIMTRIGAHFQDALDQRVFDAVVRKSGVAPDLQTQSGLDDLEAIQRFMTSPVLLAFFDFPWVPIFFTGIFIFHPLLGWTAVGGGVLLIGLTLANEMFSRNPQISAMISGQQAVAFSTQIREKAEMVQAMGMRRDVFKRWKHSRSHTLDHQIKATDVRGDFLTLIKTLRLFLQSVMLGIAAYLILNDQMTPGGMIAGTVLLGRGLAPIETMLHQWSVFQRAQRGWSNLSELLGTVPIEKPLTPLPKPKAHLVAKGLTIVPPGEKKIALRNIAFEINPGQAMGVIGPSGAGKSTLARAVTGVWRPASGSLRLDGATLDHYEPSVLGQHIGYLPQRIQLFDGTISENIARLAEEPDAEAVVHAAQSAAAHDMILQLPNGYDTHVRAIQNRLSGGQLQRIGLARAMYGDPVILVLDEPNSNLDNAGSAAVNEAIRRVKARGGAALIIAHRPAALQECDLLLVIDDGAATAFGPRDDVLKKHVKNHNQIAKAPLNAGGVT